MNPDNKDYEILADGFEELSKAFIFQLSLLRDALAELAQALESIQKGITEID